MDLHPCDQSSSLASTLGQVIPDPLCKPDATPGIRKFKTPLSELEYGRAKYKTPEYKEWYTAYRKKNAARIKARQQAYHLRTLEHRESRRAKRNLVNRVRWQRIKAEQSPAFLRRQQRNRAYIKRYRKEHPEIFLERGRKYRARNAAHIATLKKAWNIKHYDQHRSHVNKAGKKWREKNPEKTLHYANSRRARKYCSNGDNSAVVEIARIRSLRSVPCYYCGKRVSGKKAHIDHIVPLIAGGLHTASNLCASCPNCNLKKNRHLLGKWQPNTQQPLLPI